MSDWISPKRGSDRGGEGVGEEPVAPPAPGRRGLNTMYSRRQLEVVLHRERARADRNASEFSLILFRARAEDRRLTLRLARLLNRRCRTIDELGWFDDACIATLLPYTGADGARAFAEDALKLAQEALIPAICRVYTYPTAWYFDEDRHHHNGHGGVTKPTSRRPGESDSKPAHAGGNGHGHNGDGGNGNSPIKLAPDAHDHSNGNGNGNSHSHGGNGNGNGNGNGHAKATLTAALPLGVTTLQLAERRSPVADAVAELELEPITEPSTKSAPRTEMAAADLVPYVMQGFSDGLIPPDAGADGVETLLVRHLPWWKRAIDVVGATFGLIALSPVMIFSAILIKGTSRGPVIFRQRRAGLGGQPFWIYKFRTMSTDAEARKAALRKYSEQDGPAFKLSDDPRVTAVGRVLRETSLDELPQLWNVLKGDMSLVGPRPLPMDEAAECEQWQRGRLDVTPGLTCIWQVKGRSRVSFAEWMRMDLSYIRRHGILHDVKILCETIPAVLMRRGAR